METDKETIEKDHPRSSAGCLKFVGCGVLILALLSALGMIGIRIKSAGKLQNMLVEMDRDDPGWRPEDIEAAREEVPEEENSARVVLAAVQQMPQPPLRWPSADFHDENFRRTPPNEKLNGEDFLLLSKELASARTALNIALKLADMPRGRHPLHNASNPMATLLPHVQECRNIVNLLVYESMRRNQKGESKNAITACRAALNVARSIGDEPFYISQLVRLALVIHVCQAIERTLAQGEPPIEDMTVLQQILETEDALPSLLAATRGERAFLHKVFELVERGELSPDQVDSNSSSRPDRLKSTLIDLWRMDTREDHALFLSMMNRRIEELKRPMSEQAGLEKQFEQDVRDVPKNAVITRLLLPAMSKMGGAFRRKHAYLRCTIVALAAERYRREKKTWPENVNHLCPQYLAAVPVDPYDGAPLRYRRVRDGLVIYCVGPDAVDNGGNLDPDNSMKTGTDLGFRLWDAAKRRQPPRPKPPDDAERK
ncbi:MAG: hypothetical protein ACYC3I_08840 [Gemmataceae bacterium]